jgi:4-hydroxy-tetrahydrodipicolinate reductase
MKIGVAGCSGRVGALLVDELLSGRFPDAQLSGGTVRSKKAESAPYYTTESPEALFERSDAVIDFTRPEASLELAELAARHNKILVVGTTGFDQEQEKLLRETAKKTAIVYAANMSLGVNLLMALVEQAARKLSLDWDIEIFESHHRYKIDSPSGTALALGKAAAMGRGFDLPLPVNPDRSGKREKGEIGFSVSRGGDIVGEHVVSFLAEGERVEFAHRATNRALFARGAIHAALWAGGKPSGLYSMRDVLSL